MYQFSTDPKKIRERIRRYERSLRKDPPYGLHDGYGKRYLLGPLYLMLGNIQDTLDHYKWYQDTYPHDSGCALNFLCWAITLYRHGDIEEAEEKLISTVLSNVLLIPFILGHKMPTLGSWEDRYYDELMEIDYFPNEILEFITGEEKKWIGASYSSSKITAIRKTYIEIEDQLENLPRGEKRTKLCHDLYRIRALDFSGVDFSKIGTDQTSGNSGS